MLLFHPPNQSSPAPKPFLGASQNNPVLVEPLLKEPYLTNLDTSGELSHNLVWRTHSVHCCRLFTWASFAAFLRGQVEAQSKKKNRFPNWNVKGKAAQVTAAHGFCKQLPHSGGASAPITTAMLLPYPPSMPERGEAAASHNSVEPPWSCLMSGLPSLCLSFSPLLSSPVHGSRIRRLPILECDCVKIRAWCQERAPTHSDLLVQKSCEAAHSWSCFRWRLKE